MDWFDLLAVQGTLKSLLQHHSSKASILRCSAFFIVQLSHPYRTTGETRALTRWTFVGKAISFISIVVFLSNTMKATLTISCFTWSGLIAFTSTSVLTFLPLQEEDHTWESVLRKVVSHQEQQVLFICLWHFVPSSGIVFRRCWVNAC